MKTRFSLVSNSSSSSFIISFYLGAKCKCCGRGPANLIDKITMIELTSCDSNTQIYARGKEKVIKYVNDAFYDPEEKKRIIEQLEIQPDDCEIAYFSISMHNDDLLSEIDAIEKTGGQIIYRGEG